MEESSSNCWKFQHWSLRCVEKRFSRKFFAIVVSFKWNFKFVQEIFLNVWRFFCKGFVLWHITIEWERFEVRFSNISKFFNLKFYHLRFIWIKKHNVCFNICVQQNVIFPNGVFEGHGKVWWWQLSPLEVQDAHDFFQTWALEVCWWECNNS